MAIARQIGCAAALLAVGLIGDDSSEYQVKAAFLCNFAKFVEWPPQTFKTADDPVVICVLGTNPFGNALQTTASHSEAEGRKFEIRNISEVRPGSRCQVVFVCAAERKHLKSFAESIRGSAILTVSESPGSISDGGIINFKLVEGRVRFEINPDAAKRANLRINSRLLSLAEIKK
jgi:uncharacterized protein DUF4154